MLLNLLTQNGTDRTSILTDLCSQQRYDGLVTCLLWDFTTVQSTADAAVVAKDLCDHNIITNSSLCDMVEIQQRLVNIVNETSPREILCQDNTTVLVYDSDEVKDEVKPRICNMSRDELELLLMTIVDHVNITALWELYFPDGFDPIIFFELAQNLQELSEMPTIQVSSANRQTYI